MRALTLDSLALPRLDLLKIDVEGMELDALAGAAALHRRATSDHNRRVCKSDRQRLTTTLEGWGYRHFPSASIFWPSTATTRADHALHPRQDPDQMEVFMIVDLRIYTCKPNRMNDFVALYKELAGHCSRNILAAALAGSPPWKVR